MSNRLRQEGANVPSQTTTRYAVTSRSGLVYVRETFETREAAEGREKHLQERGWTTRVTIETPDARRDDASHLLFLLSLEELLAPHLVYH